MRKDKFNRPWYVSEVQPGVILDSIGFPVCSASILPVPIHNLNDLAEFIVRLVNENYMEESRIDEENLNAVYQEIMRERVYQDLTFGTVEQHPHEFPGWIAIMQNALKKATAAWINGTDDDEMIKEMIQATAVGFACLQQYGIPEGAKRGIHG